MTYPTRASGLVATIIVALGLLVPGTAATATATAAATAAAMPAATAEATASAEGEQSDQPAPPSRDKRVVGAVHTDTVSVYLDDGQLTLDSRADIDVTGDGVVDTGSRIPASETIFHLSSESRTEVPDLAAYRFLGDAGSEIWMAPQTQNHALIWPGFSTEDPNLAGRVGGNEVALTLADTAGPGDVELYLQSGTTVTRTFSSREELPPWRSGVPQHTHMNWVFSAAGTYTLTFEASATVDGQVQTARNDYVFVVGDLDAHRAATSTTLSASPVDPDAGEQVAFTALVDPAGAAGAVQFTDATSDTLLGHAPVIDGEAHFSTDALAPGAHRIVAEFVPSWSTDFEASLSEEVSVTVGGEVQPRPENDDADPVTDQMMQSIPAGQAVTIPAAQKTVVPGSALSLRVPSSGGQWLSIWMPELQPAWRGWHQSDLSGRLSIEIPAETPAADYRVAVKAEDGTFVGWDAFTVEAAESETPPPAPTPTPVPPAPAPAAPTQQCTPGLVLETGHIDAFNVSAGAGRAVLQIKEDVTGHNVLREVESVLLRVKPSAYRSDIPRGTPGAPAGYVLPLTQNSQLIWPGWDTNRTAASGYSDVSIFITDVNGPGRIHISSQGSFGNVTPLLQSGGYQLPGVLRERTPAHTHAQWVFSEKGIYKLRVHAVVTNPSTGGSVRTAAHTYVFQVGDVPLGDALCGLHSAGAGDSDAVAQAVDNAAAEAVAAAQAEAAEEAALAVELEPNAYQRGMAAPVASAVEAPDAVTNNVLVTALLGGGVLVTGGVIGVTVWHLRRLKREELSLLGSDL